VAGGPCGNARASPAIATRLFDTVAVDEISFAAEPGQVFGLLGPNGAGKTTTIGCISGLLTPKLPSE